MTQELRWKFLFILILGIVSAYFAVPLKDKPFFKEGQFLQDRKIDLGIDLQGGAELTYKILPKDDEQRQKVGELAQRAVDVLRKRIDIRGLKEPRLNKQGDDKILIQLPGIDSDKLKAYKELFNTVGSLEIREIADKDTHRASPPAEGKVLSGFDLVVNTEKGGPDWLQGRYIWGKKGTIITGEHIEKAYEANEPGYGWLIHFELNKEGSKLFYEATSKLASKDENKKGYTAIMLDGKLISRPGVESAIEGKGFIHGSFDEKGAKDLATVLKSGSLPAPIGRMTAAGEKVIGEPEAENFVGPTLGQDAIKRGFFASAIAFIGVALFMLIYYRASGFVAVGAVLLNVILVLAIMAFFGATLTLPGIAGIVLTVGMAVDANILIYERIREEKEKGKTPLQSFEAGHERALVTIVDANVTTFIAGAVLYYFGTGPIKGFAVTLCIGILTTLFTAVWCSKVFLRMMLASGTIKEFKMMRLFQKPNINFVKVTRLAMLFSAILIAFSIFFFAKRGDKNYGMDFKGGTSVTINFNSVQKIDDIRRTVRGITIKNEKGENVSKYPDAEIQTVASQAEGLKNVSQFIVESNFFQIRTQNTNNVEILKDLSTAFTGKLSVAPFEELPLSEFPPNTRDKFYNGVTEKDVKGGGTYIYIVNSQNTKLEDVVKKIKDVVKDSVRKDELTGEPLIFIEEKKDAPNGLSKLKIIISKEDKTDDRIERVKEAIKGNKDNIPLSSDPFVNVGTIGPSVAHELKASTIWALIWSWILMIIYIGFRFHSWVFGLAAVIALIHDAIISIGAVAFCGLFLPERLGLNFDLNLPSVAAILTVMGYSVNDTIVVFDRIRENLGLMKRETFPEIINASVNQTVSRTVLTSFTTWISVALLYFVSMRASSSIENLAFPVLVGIIIGTYSSIYIASPILIEWYKGRKPEIAG